ncbi:MAG: Gfo/Idh/MocA family oxidoreductase, partial [Pseudomonadota bacterium]
MNYVSNRTRIGVVGVGSMGHNHARILSNMEDCEFIGIYDSNEARAEEICNLYGCRGFGDLDLLLSQVQAVVVATPTVSHGHLGEKCLNFGVHVLMEKPLASSVIEAEKLVRLAQRNNLVLMVGHVERYNPAVNLMIELIKKNKEPVISIEARRLNPFDGNRCLDVDVLYDLLIHDIDIALEIADSTVHHICSVGQKVYSNLVDDAHSLLQFKNRITAVFWTSKCSPRKIREVNVATRTRFYQANTINRSLIVHTAKDVDSGSKGVCFMSDIMVEEMIETQSEPLRL